MRNLSVVLVLCTVLFFAACSDVKSSDKMGELDAQCYPNKTCNEGLSCEEESNLCKKIEDVAADDSDDSDTQPDDGTSDTGTENADTESHDSADPQNDADTADSGSDSGDSQDDSDTDNDRKQGELYGECYPNETCNKGLSCDVENNICIKDPGNNDNPDDDADTSDSGNDSGDTQPDDDTDTEIVEPDPCDGVDCGGFGVCALLNGSAYCICDPGYHQDGDNPTECIADTDPCEDVDCGHGICVARGDVAYCICEAGYYSDLSNLACIATTQRADCSPKPDNTVWNDGKEGDEIGTFIQNLTDSGWEPAEYPSTYNNTEAGTCRYVCEDGYFWYNSKCVLNPCEPSFCDIDHSTGRCFPENETEYSCECTEGYFWSGEMCAITHGRICTGQTKCYNEEIEIPCLASVDDVLYRGQDALYAQLGYCFPQSFSIDSSVEGENIVVDNNTGLQWQQIIPTEKYSWDDAVAYCDDLGYAGKRDWRLPTINELLTIVDNSQYDPVIDTVYFHNVKPSTHFWASSSISTPSYHWYVAFATGNSFNSTTETSKLYVRCVRGKSFPKNSFEITRINNENVVKDTLTGLMWQEAYEGSEEGKTWSEALSYCENLIYGGYSDWRLPNKTEMASLINYDKSEAPYSDFPNVTESSFWTSSTSTVPGLLAAAFKADLTNGWIGIAIKTQTHLDVRCVRSDRIDDPCENNKSCENVANSTGVCIPRNAFEYLCECENDYFWDGTKCVSPCEENPCNNVADSTKICIPQDLTEYACECENGYYWWGHETGCTNKLSLGNICTGQTKCYNNKPKTNITCPTLSTADFYGQDAQYAALGLCTPKSLIIRTISSQKVVEDLNTGLIWQQTNPTDTYTWENAKTYCEDLVYAGSSDWRLPTPQEFLTIVQINNSYVIDTTKFPNMSRGRGFWTLKEDIQDSGNLITSYSYAFETSFGEISAGLKTGTAMVMCVSGKELPKSTFKKEKVNDEIVVKDLATGLIWQKTYERQKTWQEALSYCENLEYAGYDDWRLPNKNELASLADFDVVGVPFSNFPDIPHSYFWTSSSSPWDYVDYDFSVAFEVSFSLYYIADNVGDGKATPHYVKCVRSE